MFIRKFVFEVYYVVLIVINIYLCLSDVMDYNTILYYFCISVYKYQKHILRQYNIIKIYSIFMIKIHLEYYFTVHIPSI